ncbi:Protein unc-13 D [Orchesella cincta]|uniref:Protein unc-13 D n=1 Tax=Orchesella cincta TaxID=48709 RepID=A0A1D2MS51_ORCCI|nr:Protein unc-13 D [Orchesella cincta]
MDAAHSKGRRSTGDEAQFVQGIKETKELEVTAADIDDKRLSVDTAHSKTSEDQNFIFKTIPRDRPRSQPPQNKFKRLSGPENSNNKGGLVITNARNTLKRSSSNGNIPNTFESRNNLGLAGDSNNNFGDIQVTRHALYKEAIYTCVHMLGAPSPNRFPATQEEMCLYTHEAFSASHQEQVAVLDHVRNEPFPLTIINTKVRRAQGLQGPKQNGFVDSYCLVTIEAEHSLGKREWQKFSITSPLRSKTLDHSKKTLKPTAESRGSQVYERIPQFVKTSVQRHKKNPEWDQRFQCLSLRPSVDYLTVEVWDHSIDDKYVAKAIRNYTEPEGSSDLDATLKNVHANADRKKGDIFLGKVSMRVSEIPCDGVDDWFNLKSQSQPKDTATYGKIRLQIWLVHAYRHGKHFEEVAEPKVILAYLWDWVLQTERAKYDTSNDWDGSIPQAATCLLFQYALQNGISEDTHAIIRWNAYAKHDLNLHSVENRLQELNGVIDKQVKAKGDGKPPERIRNSQAEIEDRIMDIVKNKICPIIRNHLKEHIDDVHEALRSYKECLQILSKFEEPFLLQKVQWLFDAALRMSILEWYQDVYRSTVPSRGEVKKSEYVSSVVQVMSEVNTLLKNGAAKWGPEFWLIVSVEYLPIAYDELQKMVIHDVETICWLFFEFYFDYKKLRKILLKNEENEKELCMAFFNLYAQTQIFVFAYKEIFPEGKKSYCCLNEYHRWFRPILILWLGFALIRGSSIISKTINIDSNALENEHAMTSSSALDTANVFCQFINFWNTLNWPDVPESYIIIHFLLDVICSFTILYAELKHAKLDKEGYYDPEGKYTISERLCIALNNIEYVKEHAQRIPREINLDNLVALLEDACGRSLEIIDIEKAEEETREQTMKIVDRHMDEILRSVGLRVQREISKYVEDSYWRLMEVGSSTQLHGAMEPIIAYLEDNIITLQQSLLPYNFLKVLQLLWDLVCRGLLDNASKFMMTDTEDQQNFFRRLLQVIPFLQSYFEGGDAGLTTTDMYTEEFEQTHRLFSYFTMSTEDLIPIYYSSRCLDHIKYKGSANFGTVRVRTGYWNEKLSIEVMSAANLTAHDEPLKVFQCFQTMQPTSDPLVELELKPLTHFPDEKKYSTAVQWKNLNPTFNETFHWNISPNDCLQQAATLVVTVKDYDLLTRNAFLGEALYPLHLIPGISQHSEPQPMNLKLHEANMNHPVLTVLKSRNWDATAKLFCEDQFSRFVEPVAAK